jgi:amino acid efflux transporter
MGTSPARPVPLSVPRAAALYIGALFGPGLLLLPGLAAQQAGPASILAWVALLGLSGIFAAMFAALGQKVPSGAGAAGYAAAGLGRRAGAMTRWWFLAGVISGAPVVCLIGASYVTALTGGGPLEHAAIAAGLLLAVLGLSLGGVRASTLAQLLLVALLIAVVIAAVAGSAPGARPANWTPFAPHGWLSVGRAGATLMLSFVGWEAVAPLTGRLRAGQLPRVIGIAFAVTALLYLGLAVATVSCLGRGADLSVPLADLLQLAIGRAGRAVAAVAGLVLTAGAVNAYLSGASEMLREMLAEPGRPQKRQPPVRLFLGCTGLVGLTVITLSALRLADTAALVSVPTAMFLCVYLTCTAAAVRILSGPVRAASAVALLAVLTILAFCGGPALTAAAVIAATTVLAQQRARASRAHPAVEDRARNFSIAAGVTGVKKLTRLPSGSRNSSDRLPHGIVVGSVTKSSTKPASSARGTACPRSC